MSRIKTNAYTPPVDCRSASFFAKITGQEPGTFFTRARQTWFERVNGIPAACSSSASDHLVSALATPEWIATGTDYGLHFFEDDWFLLEPGIRMFGWRSSPSFGKQALLRKGVQLPGCRREELIPGWSCLRGMESTE
jgi:hypothetical protein